MPTILLLSLTNVATPHNLRSAVPPGSAAAQYETVLPIAVGALLLLLLVAIVLFWRLSRKPRGTSSKQPLSPEKEPAQIVVPLPPPLPITVSLEFATESGEYIRFTVDKPALTIGRAADNDIVLAAPILNVDTVSQHHVRLRRDQDDYIVRDLGSKNGLAVNGRQTIENLLQDGDRLQLGEVEATFHQVVGGAA